MADVLQAIWAGIISATWLEQSATVLGVIGVVLMVRQNLWAFPVGLVQVTLWAVVSFHARLYAGMALQGVFFAALVYGWWHWTHAPTLAAAREQIPVTRLSARGLLGYIALALAAAALWGWGLARYTDAAVPHWDASIAAFSVVAQWLQARKKLENWSGWMFVNAVALGVYGSQGLYWFAFLYAVFLGLAVSGHRAWLRSWREEAARG
jgi:nicotinamide mononucleotide transporter